MAAPSTQIQPLRVQKGSNNSSPNKMAFAQSRPLSEISPMALRRNSPSFPRGSMIKPDSSPATSSPFSPNNTSSTRLFWQGRDPQSPSCENHNPNENLTPSKRSSIENLKKASRVKNSSMFAREQKLNYDPSKPNILDGKPLKRESTSNALGEAVDDRAILNSSNNNFGGNLETANSPQAIASSTIPPLSPSKNNASPTKSSLSKRTGANFRRSGFDPDTGIWEDEDDEEKKLPEGQRLRRHAKSVTFDQAPPQINEYEMTTPDPSSVASGSREGSYDSYDEDEDEEYSFERGSSMDHDDSFDASLEDTDKTPVVLPEDWRFMSPDHANTHLSRHEEDVFDDEAGSPPPSAQPGLMTRRSQQTSLNSVDSNGHARPLPPIPQQSASNETNSPARDGLSGALERMSGTHRGLPSPPPAASMTKSDLRAMSNGSLSVEDRLRLMKIKDQDQPKSEAELQRERRMRRAGSKDVSPVREQMRPTLDESNQHAPTQQNNRSKHVRRLSRDLILQQLRGMESIEDFQNNHSDDDGDESHASYDPDVPIPSREDPTQSFNDEQHHTDVYIKEEEVDENDLYSITDLYNRKTSGESLASDEENSQYSQPSIVGSSNKSAEENIPTPRAQSPVQASQSTSLSSERMSLPDFSSFGQESSFDFGLAEYITPPTKAEVYQPSVTSHNSLSDSNDLPDLAALRMSIQRPMTPTEQLVYPRPPFADDSESAEPGTPSSVIRHPISESPSPEIPEPEATLRSTDKRLKVRPSLTASEIGDSVTSDAERSVSDTPETDDMPPAVPEKDVPASKRVSSLVQLDLPREETNDDLGMGLEKEFDRVVEAQKRGYLMRQNTKIVVASERASQEEPRSPTTAPSGFELPTAATQPNEVQPSPRKISQPTWTAEPWNGRTRRKSIRIGGEHSPTKRKPVDGPAPPLPGHASIVQDGLGAVTEDDLAEEEAEELEDGAERGRLFVKVVGAKDLQLPFPQPQNEKTHFALTLDNGLHCVTTAWLDLARHAPIGQEFELVVLNDLEFQLTLQMKLEEPKIQRPVSPTKAPPSPKKQGALGRLFGSPKKKKDSDLRGQLETQTTRQSVTPPTTYELVRGLVAKDGSFARAYVSLSEYEKQAYGRPYSVDVVCFNEWAMEEVQVGSSRSKKTGTELQQRPPYEIGKLELQLLYVPKPKGAKDEDMPKSMNGAIRAMREADEKNKQEVEVKEFEGFLSQQGGDCPYWRRRFFKLVGSKLTAYHESTRQPRATINLAKAAKLIDDKSSLTQKETSTKGGGRRKSAFADDEEGYMFVEEGFRIKFANGEVIDFYGENAAAKDEWMKALGQVIGKSIGSSSSSGKAWTEMVLKREKSLHLRSQAGKSHKEMRSQHPQSSTTQQVNKSPHKASGIPTPANSATGPVIPPRMGHARTESHQEAPGARSQANSPVKTRLSREERLRKTKSMFG